MRYTFMNINPSIKTRLLKILSIGNILNFIPQNHPNLEENERFWACLVVAEVFLNFWPIV